MVTKTIDLYPDAVGTIQQPGWTGSWSNLVHLVNGSGAPVSKNMPPGSSGDATGGLRFRSSEIPRNAIIDAVSIHAVARVELDPRTGNTFIHFGCYNAQTLAGQSDIVRRTAPITSADWQAIEVPFTTTALDYFKATPGFFFDGSLAMYVSRTSTSPGRDYDERVYLDSLFLRVTYTYDEENQQPNLVRNGFAESENNSNFAGFIFTREDAVPGARGSFKYTGPALSHLGSDEYVPVDPTKFYAGSVAAKYVGPVVPGGMRLGLKSYDVDRLEISTIHHFCMPGTLTTLVNDLKVGDTEIQLPSGMGAAWLAAYNSSQFRRGVIIWTYRDSTGYLYPPETYSRNATTIIDRIEGDTVILSSPWSSNRGSHNAGSPLSLGGTDGDGSGYNYFIASTTPTPSVWTRYTGVIGDIREVGQRPHNRFRPGTRYIRFETSLNTGDAAATTLLASVYFGEVPVRQLGATLNADSALAASLVRVPQLGGVELGAGEALAAGLTRVQLLGADLSAETSFEVAKLVRVQLLALGLESSGSLETDLVRVQMLSPAYVSEAIMQARLFRVLPDVRGPSFSIQPNNSKLVVS